MFGLSLHILELIEHFIDAHVAAISVTVEYDRQNGILKIIIKDNSPVYSPISDETKIHPMKHSENTARGVDIGGLRLSAEKARGIFKIGKSKSGQTTVAATVNLNSIKGEIHHDLAVMLSSIVCTNPDLDLTFEFRIGEQACSMRVSDIKNKLPSERTGGLTVARAVQEKIKAELHAFEELTVGRSIMSFTVCPFCSCGCQVIPRKSASGNLIGLVPLRRHPVSEGSLCIRGWNSCDYVFHSDRIDAPLIMRDGKQTKCTWNEALEKAAADLQMIMQRWGPESIAFIGSPRCSNEDNYLLMKLARQVVGTGSIDTSHRLTHFPILDALYDSCGVGASTASFDTLACADLILVVGADATSSAPQAASRIFHALNGKAELIVVDPRSTKLAKQATHHWKVRPGSDSYWINAMTCYLIEEKKVSADFLDRKTTGFAAMKKEMGQFSLSLAETKTGIPPDSLKLAANRLATAKRAVFIIGDGAGDGGEVKKTVYGLVNLAFVTGHGGGDGSGIIVVGGENNTQGAWDMGVLPDRLPGGMPIDKCNKDTLIRLNFDTQPVVGRDYGQIMRGILSGEIRGLYVMGENLLAFREQDRAFIDALAQLESLVVQEIFPNYLTAMAAVVFPASAPYEREGTYTNLERRVQRFESIVKPQRETKPDWEIICRVAKAMGAGFTYLSTNEINDEIAIRVPFYEGLNSQALGKMRDGIRWPEANDGGKGCPWLQANWKGTFYCSNFDELDKVETSEEFPLVLICGHLPSFWNTGTRSSRSALLSREENRAALQLNPDDARRFQVREGWRVNVIHSSGNMQTSVVFSEDLPTGVAFLPLHNVDGRPPLVGKRHIPVRVESC